MKNLAKVVDTGQYMWKLANKKEILDDPIGGISVIYFLVLLLILWTVFFFFYKKFCFR